MSIATFGRNASPAASMIALGGAVQSPSIPAVLNAEGSDFHRMLPDWRLNSDSHIRADASTQVDADLIIISHTLNDFVTKPRSNIFRPLDQPQHSCCFKGVASLQDYRLCSSNQCRLRFDVPGSRKVGLRVSPLLADVQGLAVSASIKAAVSHIRYCHAASFMHPRWTPQLCFQVRMKLDGKLLFWLILTDEMDGTRAADLSIEIWVDEWQA
ncbi:hypothetical protein EJ03DRAFT_218600 [Teratosphaeria nubilosa]|uniref:Uncharacterized protein n=1 Tax=Teratosphaeria nubilosa TaxID=161662 RepID=A0A6G1KYM9_9PEZI|nr:hypothetical protein EJ03DRAFT_218600 [Teratosphaeria nubilosa]